MKPKYKRYASKMREDLYRQLKLISTLEDRQIQELIEEAVTEYLDKRKITEDKSEDGEWTTVRFSTVKIAAEPEASYEDEKKKG